MNISIWSAFVENARQSQFHVFGVHMAARDVVAMAIKRSAAYGECVIHVCSPVPLLLLPSGNGHFNDYLKIHFDRQLCRLITNTKMRVSKGDASQNGMEMYWAPLVLRRTSGSCQLRVLTTQGLRIECWTLNICQVWSGAVQLWVCVVGSLASDEQNRCTFSVVDSGVFAARNILELESPQTGVSFHHAATINVFDYCRMFVCFYFEYARTIYSWRHRLAFRFRPPSAGRSRHP